MIDFNQKGINTVWKMETKISIFSNYVIGML